MTTELFLSFAINLFSLISTGKVNVNFSPEMSASVFGQVAAKTTTQ